jgi:hypothetical protein
LVEGGAGYRFNVLRCDLTVMRRKPNSTFLPIRVEDVEFCQACWYALRDQVNNFHSTDLTRRPRILLDSQRPLCDMVRWRKATPVAVNAPFDLEVGSQPAWSCRVEADNVHGLRLLNVKLKNRPDDPFKAAEEVFERIEFGNLAVEFVSQEIEESLALHIADAFANKTTPPLLVLYKDSTSPEFLAAVRLTLTWHLQDRWTIEAVMSVVFKDKANDFDPGRRDRQ